MPLLSFRNVCCLTLIGVSAAACGGAVFGSRNDPGDGGSSSTGSSSQGGTSSTAGKPSKGGSSTTGGKPGVAGSTSMGGQPDCTLLPCPYPQCSDGQKPITQPGECCPSCPPPQTGCDNVMCQSVINCPDGYTLTQPPGACCAGCQPPPGGVACSKIACPDDDVCPAGFVRGDLVGGCCYECLPDPLFCNSDKECVIADRPRSCCGCPEAITRRAYNADVCWSDVTAPRMIPQSCYPEAICDAICNACPLPGTALCLQHRCTDRAIGAK